jgi:hypothetical protein
MCFKIQKFFRRRASPVFLLVYSTPVVKAKASSNCIAKRDTLQTCWGKVNNIISWIRELALFWCTVSSSQLILCHLTRWRGYITAQLHGDFAAPRSHYTSCKQQLYRQKGHTFIHYKHGQKGRLKNAKTSLAPKVGVIWDSYYLWRLCSKFLRMHQTGKCDSNKTETWLFQV